MLTISRRIAFVPLGQARQEITMQVVCIPPAGANAYAFRSWQEGLPGDLRLWGAEIAWTAERTFDDLSEELADAVVSQLPQVPFVLAGYSLGALLAFGAARTLRQRRAQQPLGLIVVAMSAPQLYRPGPDVDRWTPDDWRAAFERLGSLPPHALGDSALLKHLARRVRGGLATAQTFNYEAEPPFSFPIAAYGGEADQDFASVTIAAWGAHTTHSFAHVIYPFIGHFDLLRTPAARSRFLLDLLTTLRQWQGVAV